jgi:hypothetical protein
VNGAARSYWAAGQLFMDSQLSHYYDQAGMLTYVGTVASAGSLYTAGYAVLRRSRSHELRWVRAVGKHTNRLVKLI